MFFIRLKILENIRTEKSREIPANHKFIPHHNWLHARYARFT